MQYSINDATREIKNGLEIVRLREENARLKEALGILTQASDNEATAYPWWAIVQRAGLGRHTVLAGPFFSREAAEAQRNARLYEYGQKSLVYCFSGHESRQYRKLLSAAKGAA